MINKAFDRMENYLEEQMKQATNNSIIGVIADNLGLNKSLHHYKEQILTLWIWH